MDYINSLVQDADNIDTQLYEIALYSEGSITLTEASLMSYTQREKTMGMLNKKIERQNGKEQM